MLAAVARLIVSLALLAACYWSAVPPAAAHDAGLAVVDAPDLDGLLVASREHYAAGAYREALAPTEALVARFPAQHVYLERLAFIYQHLKRYQDEAAAWGRFMARSPTPWDACPAVARAHAAAGDDRAAFAAYETCWKVAPRDADAAFFLALAHERRGDAGQALDYYRQALAIDSSHADAQLGLARLELHAGRFDAARTLAQAVIVRVPAHADAHLIVAQAAQRSGDAQAAREHFARTLAIEEKYFDAHVGLGLIELASQNTQAARQHFERAAVVDPRRVGELANWLDRAEPVR
jgi:tetratricopeptide (TPR) repeat protein